MGFNRPAPGPGAHRPPPIYRDWTLLQLAALVFVLDQFTKYLVVQLLPFGWSFPQEGFFRFTHIHNTGSAFGMLQGQNTPLIFVSFVGILILVLIYRSQPHPSNLLRLALGLQIGGAFGNLVDRLRWGYVIDFIDVGAWPIFNIADASIVTGLCLLAWVFLGPGRKHEPVAAPDTGRDEVHRKELQWCPVCDGDMVPAPGGCRCTGCGVRERWVYPTPEPRYAGVMSLVAAGDQARLEELQWCPVCDGDMVPAPGGWRCTGCGVRERMEDRQSILPEAARFSPTSATGAGRWVDGRGPAHDTAGEQPEHEAGAIHRPDPDARAEQPGHSGARTPDAYPLFRPRGDE